jgi:hypothetical protein
MKNKTGGVPIADGIFGEKLPINYDFKERNPIFWGPNQLTSYPNEYVEPSLESVTLNVRGFKDKLPLIIPRVVRCFFVNETVVTTPCGEVGTGQLLLAYRHFETVQLVGRSTCYNGTNHLWGTGWDYYHPIVVVDDPAASGFGQSSVQILTPYIPIAGYGRGFGVVANLYGSGGMLWWSNINGYSSPCNYPIVSHSNTVPSNSNLSGPDRTFNNVNEYITFIEGVENSQPSTQGTKFSFISSRGTLFFVGSCFEGSISSPGWYRSWDGWLTTIPPRLAAQTPIRLV